MSAPDLQTLIDVLDATWPPASVRRDGPWVIREGQGGGSRVGAIRLAASSAVSDDDITAAVAASQALGQKPVFQIFPGQEALDRQLERLGFEAFDATRIYLGPVDKLARFAPGGYGCYVTWPPLAITRRIWHRAGIDAPRLAVMARAKPPKAALLVRRGDDPAGVAFVAAHGQIAMLHALEILPDQRRRGAAFHILGAAAEWAQDLGCRWLSLAVTAKNFPANQLYAKAGMSVVAGYHYRRGPKNTD